MPTCGRCGHEVPPENASCPVCGAQPTAAPASTPPPEASQPERKYAMLGVVRTVLRVLGWIVLISGPFVGLAAGASDGGAVGAVGGFFAGAVLGVLYWIMLVSYAELIGLLIDLEGNTRYTGYALSELTRVLRAR